MRQRLARTLECVTLVVLVGISHGCARDHSDTDARVAAAVESSGGDANVSAAAARYRSARARADGVTGHETMQLRLRGLTGENFAENRGVRIAVRIPMTNPWEIARTRDARNAEAEVMAYEVESEAVAHGATHCAEGMTRSAASAVAEAHTDFRDAMQPLREWAEGWVEGESLGPLENIELMLEIDRRLAGLSSPPPPPAEGVPVPLPELVDGGAFDASAESIRTRIETAHPSIRQHAAAARAYRALARRERARAAPWFGFFELGYEFQRDRPDSQNRQAIEARFGINLPLAPRPRREIEERQALAEAEELSAEASTMELARQAETALAALVAFNARAESLRALQTRAQEAEATALRFLEQRHGEPRRVVGVLVEVLQARLAIADAQRRAGLAACDLFMSTGISAADWPRR